MEGIIRLKGLMSAVASPALLDPTQLEILSLVGLLYYGLKISSLLFESKVVC
jgi:hypothetical protein